MDWAKAKTFIIILLAILNVILMVNILISSSNLSLNTEYVTYTNELLKSSDIKVLDKIPSYSRDSGLIDYKDRSIDERSLVTMLLGNYKEPSTENDGVRIWTDEGKTLEIGNNLIRYQGRDGRFVHHFDDMSKLAAVLKDYLNDLDLIHYDIVLNNMQMRGSDTVEAVLLEQYKGQLLFDNATHITLSRSGMLSWSVVARDVEKMLDPREILSAYQVLAMAGLPRHSVIAKVDFGYKKVNETELYDSPVWRILFDTGDADFYNAYSGEKLEK